ncbi:MAG: NERD domain-containing protein [Oscillospiraceae bacterium]|nr:NERD domain-containing protein [Oscillospiraceae bacterium]
MNQQMDFNNMIYLLLALVVVVTVVIVTMEREKKLPRGRKKANANAAVTALRSFAVNNGCKVLGPVRFTRGEQTVTLDGVLVGWFGVLGVKGIGYNGQIYGNPKEQQWLWVSADKRESFANPMEECTLAARMMREALMKAGVRSPESEAVVVFTDSKAELCIPRDAGVMKVADLRSYLRKEKFQKDRGYDLDVMCAALEPFVIEK